VRARVSIRTLQLERDSARAQRDRRVGPALSI
jgi:hypothetical protein